MVAHKIFVSVTVLILPLNFFLMQQLCWACGVTVSTVDSESTDPGSNPGRPIFSLRSKYARNNIFAVTHEISKLRDIKIFDGFA